MKELIDKQTAQTLNSLTPESRARVLEAEAKALTVSMQRQGKISPSNNTPNKN